MTKYSSVHHVTRGLFITLQHSACVVLVYSSVHHFTGGLFATLRHPACVVLWYLPSRQEVANNRCSLAKPPLLQDYTVVHYSIHYVPLSLLWHEEKPILDCFHGCMELIKLLGFKRFTIFSNLRLLGYKEFILLSNLGDVTVLFFYFLILGMLQSFFGMGDRVAIFVNFNIRRFTGNG